MIALYIGLVLYLMIGSFWLGVVLNDDQRKRSLSDALLFAVLLLAAWPIFTVKAIVELYKSLK